MIHWITSAWKKWGRRAWPWLVTGFSITAAITIWDHLNYPALREIGARGTDPFESIHPIEREAYDILLNLRERKRIRELYPRLKKLELIEHKWKYSYNGTLAPHSYIDGLVIESFSGELEFLSDSKIRCTPSVFDHEKESEIINYRLEHEKLLLGRSSIDELLSIKSLFRWDLEIYFIHRNGDVTIRQRRDSPYYKTIGRYGELKLERILR